jgi:acyl-CoA synthetase (AMP-forming)/AMP-acid ligase II
MFYPLTVRDFLDRAELVYPERIGVIDEPDQPAASWGEVSYRDLAARARAQAVALDGLDVPTGGRVAIVSQNAARMLTSFFGVAGWGRVLVPVNFRLSRAEIAYIVEHSGASVLLYDPEVADVVEGLDVAHTFALGESDELLFTPPSDPGLPRPWDGDEAATATINYTSGTTARPKGVQLTHRNLWLNAVTFGLHAGVTDDDVYLHTLPMFHANGWGHPFTTTGMGVTQVVIRKIDGAEILRRIERHGVTYLCAAPAVVNAVLDAAATWPGEIPGRDRVRIIVAGAPPPTITIQRVADELGWEFIQIYGLTETSPLVTMNRRRREWADLSSGDLARKLVRQGVPTIGVRIRLDETGEVLTQSNHNLDGYWEQPEATSVAQAGNWFHTGDGAEIDDEGYLHISDRKKDVIISGGENVSSIEVEDVLNSHPAVREVAVIGIPDERWGELVTALVVTDGSPVSESDLIAHCRAALAGYKCPKRVEFRDELPRTATGKLQKFRLREPFWAGRDRQVN